MRTSVPDSDRLYLGIDAGGTTCRAVLSDSVGKVLAITKAGPANIETYKRRAFVEIERSVDLALAKSGLDAEIARGRLIGVAGMAGGEWPHNRELFDAYPWPYRHIRMVHDTVIAHYGAFQGKSGALVILGTGISGLVISGGASRNFSGWAFPFDDRGAGAWIGRKAVQTALRTAQGLMPPSSLLLALRYALADSEGGLAEFTRHADARAFGRIVPIVIAQADAGDPAAKQILDESIREVEAMIAGMGVGPDLPAVLTGGISQWMVDKVDPWWRGFIRKPINTPLMGALKMARVIDES